MPVTVYFRNGGQSTMECATNVDHDRFMTTPGVAASREAAATREVTEAGIAVKDADGAVVGRFIVSEIVGYAIHR